MMSSPSKLHDDVKRWCTRPLRLQLKNTSAVGFSSLLALNIGVSVTEGHSLNSTDETPDLCVLD